MTSKGKISTEFLKTQTDRLMRAYPNMPWDKGQIQLYRDCLKRLVSSHSEDKVRTSIEETILHAEFLEVALITRNIPTGKVKKVRCDRCEEQDGYVYVMVEGETMPRAMRCDHHTPQPSVLIWIGHSEKRVQVWATVCDYVDQQYVE